MTSTLTALAAVQLKRQAALPAKMADNPFRSAALHAIQQRNATLDAIFYNVGKIDAAEVDSLAFWLAREGALLIVPPSGKERLTVCLDKAEFLAKGGAGVAALAVAGVGSSALGSAAFARDIADALDEPVAAVVSGYGLSDVLTEALGGFFWFGALNGIRHSFEGLDRQTKKLTASEPSLEELGTEFARLSKDTATLIDLLEDPAFTVPLLIGHSKGNLVISEALYALEVKGTLARVAKASRIVTVSAKVGMPQAFKGNVLDIIGQWDGFGALNSRPDIPADLIVPGAWHSTNPQFPLGMGIDMTRVMKQAMTMMSQGPLPVPPMPALLPATAALDLPQQLVGTMAEGGE